MKIGTSVFTREAGWAHGLPADLDSDSTLVLAFGAPELAADEAPFAELRRAMPRSRLVGCSTAGEIHGTAILDGSLVVVAAKLDHTEVRTATAPVARASSFEAGAALARSLARQDLRAVLVFSDGSDVNGSRLASGLRSVLGDTPVSGGLAADGTRFQRTWVLAGERPRAGVACAVGLYGDRVRVAHGTKGGWDEFGPERRITRSKENVLFELDGRPALALYERYLGDRALGLPATALLYPLAIRATPDDEERLVRTVLAHSPADQSLTFAGDVPEGAYAQLMRANFDRLVLAAGDAATECAPLAPAGESLCLAVSCVGRRLVLGARSEEETEAIADVLPRGATVAGFYSYGEIAPHGALGCGLHNQTMTLTTVSEV